jgi:hypothetical protein
MKLLKQINDFVNGVADEESNDLEIMQAEANLLFCLMQVPV